MKGSAWTVAISVALTISAPASAQGQMPDKMDSRVLEAVLTSVWADDEAPRWVRFSVPHLEKALGRAVATAPVFANLARRGSEVCPSARGRCVSGAVGIDIEVRSVTLADETMVVVFHRGYQDWDRLVIVQVTYRWEGDRFSETDRKEIGHS